MAEVLIDAHAQVVAALTVSGATVLVMATIIACGHLRGCSGRHSGASADAVTVGRIQADLASGLVRQFIARHVRRTIPPSPEPEEYTGRHRLPESHPDHGVPLDLPRKPRRPVDNWIPCGHLTSTGEDHRAMSAAY